MSEKKKTFLTYLGLFLVLWWLTAGLYAWDVSERRYVYTDHVTFETMTELATFQENLLEAVEELNATVTTCDVLTCDPPELAYKIDATNSKYFPCGIAHYGGLDEAAYLEAKRKSIPIMFAIWIIPFGIRIGWLKLVES